MLVNLQRRPRRHRTTPGSSHSSVRYSLSFSLLALVSSWTNERVWQVLIIKCDVLGESGQPGTVPWISGCAVM